MPTEALKENVTTTITTFKQLSINSEHITTLIATRLQLQLIKKETSINAHLTHANKLTNKMRQTQMRQKQSFHHLKQQVRHPRQESAAQVPTK